MLGRGSLLEVVFLIFYLFKKQFTKYRKKVDFPTSFPPQAIDTGTFLFLPFKQKK
jgi:hypothetical protein